MAQLEGAFSEVQIFQAHSFGLDVFVRPIFVKGGIDYECVKHKWSKV